MDKEMSALSSRDLESRAKVLFAIDALMKHLNDEDDQTDWLVNGVPDGAPPLMITREQFEYYSQFVDDFDDIVKVFARTVRRVCFKTTYEPRGFC